MTITEQAPTPRIPLTPEQIKEVESKPHSLLITMDPHEKHFGIMTFPKSRYGKMTEIKDDMRERNPHWNILITPIGSGNSAKNAARAIYRLMYTMEWTRFPNRNTKSDPATPTQDNETDPATPTQDNETDNE